jgi:hypothetical protein
MATIVSRLVTLAVFVGCAWLAGGRTAAIAPSSMPGAAADSGQTLPVPRPFPGSAPAKPTEPSPMPPTSPPTSAPPAPATPPVAANVPPDGLPVYPAAEFIDVFDAGSGQRYYLYGASAAYADVVAYYKNTLKTGGRELYRAPAMQQFDLGRFQEDSMAYPPSVVVKDYVWNGSPGYLAVSGTTEKRFRTIIQIVPPTAAAR